VRRQQIEQLTQQLLDCGYRSSQIKRIISEALEAEAEAGSSREALIVQALEEYLAFSIKCKGKGNP